MKRTKEKKLGKFDKVCKFCKQVIKGCLREATDKGDTMGTICSDNKDYWHRGCEDEKNTIKKDRKEKQGLAEV